jgi:hypothetical protein
VFKELSGEEKLARTMARDWVLIEAEPSWIGMSCHLPVAAFG